ncbi:MAG: hypothetical protein LBH32_11970 [Dysgonamonadaceae bacterium]|jgi:hypothetical protein|nr:hypothetical protein [Dysgonamonadaceae bacterium]
MKRNRILRIKSLSNGLIAAAFALVCASCDKHESDEKKGKEAAAAACKCLNNHDKDYCFEELKSNYSEYMSDDFIDAFNEAQTCGLKLYKYTIPSN